MSTNDEPGAPTSTDAPSEPSEEVHTLACGCTAKMAPGWAALEHAMHAAYERAPVYFSAKETDVEQDTPVESVACYFVDAPEPHWHLISCGMSELYDKQFINPEVSGFGIELTLRVPATDPEIDPPAWPMQLMRNLARYVAATRRPFAEGQHMNAHAPLALDTPCTLSAVCFVADAALPTLETPNGRVSFLQVFGLTDDELEAVMDSDAHDFIALVAQSNERFICDANRPSYLEDEELRTRIQERIDSAGSTAEGSHAGDLEISEVDGSLHVCVGAMHARALVRGLRHRVPFEREYLLSGQQSRLLLAPSAAVGWHVDDTQTTLMLTAEAARALADAISPERGSYRCAEVPRVVIELSPSELTDDEGNVVRVIG